MRIRVLSFVALLVVLAANAPANLHYSITPIMADGQPLRLAADVNDVGDIVGEDVAGNGVLVRAGRATALNSGSIPGIAVGALNNRDDIAGEYPGADGVFAVQW